MKSIKEIIDEKIYCVPLSVRLLFDIEQGLYFKIEDGETTHTISQEYNPEMFQIIMVRYKKVRIEREERLTHANK